MICFPFIQAFNKFLHTVHFIYTLEEADQKEFAHTCTYNILVCFSQNGHQLMLTYAISIFLYKYLITL